MGIYLQVNSPTLLARFHRARWCAVRGVFYFIIILNFMYTIHFRLVVVGHFGG